MFMVIAEGDEPLNNEKPRKCPSGDATVINLEATNKKNVIFTIL